MQSININKLRSEVEAREQRKTKLYEKILDLCYKRISSSNQKNDNYSCTYIVPNVVFGLPLYDVNECVTFIMNKLTEKEFDIIYAFPTTIHISWKPVENSKNISNKQLTIKPKESRNESRHESRHESRDTQNKNYKNIEDYNNSHMSIYDPDDINLFQNKLDNLFN